MDAKKGLETYRSPQVGDDVFVVEAMDGAKDFKAFTGTVLLVRGDGVPYGDAEYEVSGYFGKKIMPAEAFFPSLEAAKAEADRRNDADKPSIPVVVLYGDKSATAALKLGQEVFVIESFAEKGSKWSHLRPLKTSIVQVSADINCRGVIYSYRVLTGGEWTQTTPQAIYETEEDCQARCDKRNAEVAKKRVAFDLLERHREAISRGLLAEYEI